jgi:mono/diheme cytochrome c family protein
MKLAGLISLLLLFALPSKNQMVDKPAEDSQPPPVIIVLPSNKSLSVAQLEGKRVFLQRCSICHLPGMASYSTYGPLLDRKIVASLGEEAVRDLIVHGSARMPGFQYTLKAEEIDKIVQFLRIVDLSKNQ